MMRTIGKLTAPISRRLRLMVSRVVIGMVNDSLKTQRLQLKALDGEILENVERFQEYGYCSVPLPGCEGVMLAVGGVRGHAIVIATQDGRHRPINLEPGEVALYDDLGHLIHLKRTGIFIDGGGDTLTINNVADVVVDGLSVKHHVHTSVQPGAGTSGGPQ